MAANIALWAACVLLALSVGCDLRWRRIPNALPLALLGLFAVHALAGGAGPAKTLWMHLAIGAILLVAGFALYLSGRFGAGDAKLIAVSGVWVGPADVGLFLLGLGACALALSLFALLPTERTRRMRSELPFAVAIAPPAIAVIILRALSHGL